MAEGFVTVAPDSTGKSLRTETSVQGGNTVHSEVVVVSDSTGNLVGTSSSTGTPGLLVTPQDASQVTFGRSSATNMSAGIITNGQLTVAPGSAWRNNHKPAISTQATITQGAGAGSVRNYCTGLTVTMSAGSVAPTVPVTPIFVSLIDGASGGTNYLWQSVISVPSVAGTCFSIYLTELNCIGSAATAMTLEFSAAETNVFESVSMQGFQVQ
jgi:hypothetical protein